MHIHTQIVYMYLYIANARAENGKWYCFYHMKTSGTIRLFTIWRNRLACESFVTWNGITHRCHLWAVSVCMCAYRRITVASPAQNVMCIWLEQFSMCQSAEHSTSSKIVLSGTISSIYELNVFWCDAEINVCLLFFPHIRMKCLVYIYLSMTVHFGFSFSIVQLEWTMVRNQNCLDLLTPFFVSCMP